MNTPDEHFQNKIGLWWNNTPSFSHGKIGLIGMIEPTDLHLLPAAEQRLREKGCDTIIGPINGNTWNKHRAVVESSGRTPFMLEPFTEPEIAGEFQNAGFQILARYSSSVIDLIYETSSFSSISSRMEKLGVGIRQLNIERFEEDLKTIFHLSLRAFTENFLYTPISEEEFLAMYLPLKPFLNSESALIAEYNGEPVGFVFGYQENLTMIVKTLAVLPERKFAGLGTLLVHLFQQRAKQRGCTESIHALQREDNQSLRISKRFSATVFRRYALFSKSYESRSTACRTSI